jgi:signal transduction histidine kinase
MRFRFRLDGFDRTWSDALTAREAVYTNIGPGDYRFRVVASNSEGLWNGPEASLAFRVEPAFWQTWWFRLSWALALLAAGYAIYRTRAQRAANQLNLRFQERLAERTRIAQELHDTLLQGFVGASLQLHVATNRLPAESPARHSLKAVGEMMGHVIDEARNAVRGLRSASEGSDESLEQAFCRIQQDAGIVERTDFRVLVEGRVRPLHPMIRDEVYRIGRESLVNAFRHSGAGHIEIEIDYAPHQLRLLIRDDGRGIDPQILQSGRDGHWGLSGIRERAERIGAKLKLWSRANGGTEVELSVPARAAYQPRKAR